MNTSDIGVEQMYRTAAMGDYLFLTPADSIQFVAITSFSGNQSYEISRDCD